MTLVLELVGWWAATVGVWLASLSAWSGHDFVVAAGCAVPCAALAVAARRAVRGAWRPPLGLIRAVLLLPIAIVADTGRVWLAAVRPRDTRTMSFRTTRLRRDRLAQQRAGRRAVASVLLSATPGAFVVDIDPQDGTVLVHSLGPASALERVVMR